MGLMSKDSRDYLNIGKYAQMMLKATLRSHHHRPGHMKKKLNEHIIQIKRYIEILFPLSVKLMLYNKLLKLGQSN